MLEASKKYGTRQYSTTIHHTHRSKNKTVKIICDQLFAEIFSGAYGNGNRSNHNTATPYMFGNTNSRSLVFQK
tara:strand:+ start:697 stop:915 length:219 start_codon:yes stop_codon:yes gene_type:complete